MPRGKPSPDVYEKAAALLDLPPVACLAIEDSVTGSAAAGGAGCPVLVVPNDVDVPEGRTRRHVASLVGLGPVDLRRIHLELGRDAAERASNSTRSALASGKTGGLE